jgi:hypothetical protein
VGRGRKVARAALVRRSAGPGSASSSVRGEGRGGRPSGGGEGGRPCRPGGGGGVRPQVEKEPGGRRRAVACGGDGGRTEGTREGAIGLRDDREKRENLRNALAGGVSLVLQMPLQQLLEPAQWTCLLHFAVVGWSGEAAGVRETACAHISRVRARSLIDCRPMIQSRCNA